MADNAKDLLTINNFINDSNNKLIRTSRLIRDVTARSIPVVEIVNGLEEILTHDDKDVRRRGVEFISWLLFQLPAEFLSAAEIKFFATFFCSRLADHHSFIPETLKSLMALIKMKNTLDETASEMVFNIIQLVTCQAQVAKDRNTIYQILRDLHLLHPQVVEKFEPKFMCNIIASIEGETDPQNLLLLFSFLPKFFSGVEDETATVDIFEVFSTYFPVDFTTVKKDNVIISREDLADGLQLCLTSTTKLAKNCLPLILEKLDSSFKTAKIDSYKLLQRCCDRLNGTHLESCLNDLWKMLQKDLLPAQDPEIQRHGLQAMTALTGALESSPQILEKFLDDVIIAIRSLVSKPRDSLFLPATRILEALCPQSQAGAKRAFLELEVLCRPGVHSEADLQMLLPSTTMFVPYMTTQDPALHAIGSLALNTLVEVPAQRKTILQVLQKVALPLGCDDSWRKDLLTAVLLVLKAPCPATVTECCKLLRQLTKSHASEVMQVYIELEKLLKIGDIQIDVYLEVAAAIVDVPEATIHVLPQLIAFGKSSEYSERTLESLLKVARSTESHQFLRDLYSTVLELVNPRSNSTITKNCVLSYLLKETIAFRDANEQSKLMASSEIQDIMPEVWNGHAPNLVPIVEGLLGALWPEVTIRNSSVIVDVLETHALNSDCLQARESSARLLAAFVNKNSSLEILQKTAARLKSGTNLDNSERLVRLFCWTLKGALLGGIANIEPYLRGWFALLDEPALSHLVATDTKLLLAPESVFLNESCHCTVRYLYRQRLFSYFRHIAEKLRTAIEEPMRSSYLLAGVSLCSAVPQQVMLYELNNVAMVVSQAMQTNKPEVVEPALNLLLTLLQDKSSLLIDHTNSLLKTLLELSRPPASLRVRRTALQCLFFAGFYPTTFILPHRNQVIKGLVPCLDDHKRLVRNEAAKARQKWFLVGAAGEDELFQ